MSRLLNAMTPPPPRSSFPPPPPIGKKKRGGRQLRNVILSSELKFCIRQFAAKVGMPRLMEPTGFRDFRGWLERVAGPTATEAWATLVQAMVEEGGGDVQRILYMKEEVVREIVRTIVVPRPGESAKLVSTNCGRQCARPRSGNTLMTILERVLVERNVCTMEEVEQFMRERAMGHGFRVVGGVGGTITSVGEVRLGGEGVVLGGERALTVETSGASSVSVPAVSGALGVGFEVGESSRGQERLPSFQELQDSLDEHKR